MFKNIVAAVTPSSLCDPAVDKAIAFARRFAAHLHFIFVCEAAKGLGPLDYHVPFVEYDKVKKDFEGHYKQKLQKLVNYEINIHPGVVHTEILRLARKTEADLIVMGPHTKGLDPKAHPKDLAGSCLQKVCQKARCPVMIVAQPDSNEEQGFANVLVATDLSAAADHAVLYGFQLAKRYQAQLHLLHVMDLEDYLPWSLPSQREIAAYLQNAKRSLESAYAEAFQPTLDYSLEVWEGIPALEILKCARLKQADLILMAHHARDQDAERAVLGSNVVKVALNSLVPTVSINRSFQVKPVQSTFRSGSASPAPQ